VSTPPTGQVYSWNVLMDAPVAYWRFGEGSGTTLTDSSPNALNGTYAGSGIAHGVPGGIDGDPNTAVTFDGSSDPATVPDNALIDLADGPLSIELWVKRSTTLGTLQTLVNKGTNAYLLRFETNNTFTLRKTSAIATSSVAIADQLWHHIVATKNGAAASLYLDGVDVKVPGTPATLADTANALRIGHTSAGASRFIGSVDELAIYARALELRDVLHHFRGGSPSHWRTYAPRGRNRRYEVPR
jgi:Concanavalin A-like lectin/glucanases superfamily